MAKKGSSSRDRTLLILFMTLSVGIILFLISTDVFTLFSVTGLTLDASETRQSVIDRRIDAFTGHTRGQANFADLIEKFRERLQDFLNRFENRRVQFERPMVDEPPRCSIRTVCSMPPPEPLPPVPDVIPERPSVPEEEKIVEVFENPTKVTVIDLRDPNNVSATDVDAVEGVKGGGGVASSTTVSGGVPQVIRDNLIAHERFHTPANGQTTTGGILLEWGHAGSVVVQQFLVPNEYFDWFEFELPQEIRGDGFATFDGISDGEFIYKLTIPRDLIDKDTVIPVRMIIQTQNSVADVLTEIQIERPEEMSETFSVAEFFRSFFTEIRVAFA